MSGDRLRAGDERLLEARAAFARADWQAAKDLYEQVLAADPDEPDALDGLGQSSWWLGDKQTGMELRAKAFAGYQRRGDRERAGFIAALPRGRVPDRGQRLGGAGLARPGAASAGRPRRLRRPRLARDRVLEARRRAGRGRAPRPACARARPADRRLGPRGGSAQSRRPRPRLTGAGRGGDGGPRRGNGGRRCRGGARTRWRSARPAASRWWPANSSPTCAAPATSAAPSPTSPGGETISRWRAGAAPSTPTS